MHTAHLDASQTCVGMPPDCASNDLMERPSSATPQHLYQALEEMAHHPLRTIVPPWSWKAAACTAVIRALAFFAANLRSGREQATKALVVEAIFAVLAGGLIGAISQYLRNTKPLWATATFLTLILPGAMTLAQAGVHHVAGTRHQSGGLVASFFLAACAAAYTWYAMRHGAMLGGVDQTTVRHDLRALPRLSLDFLLSVPRLLATHVGVSKD
jgi:hypothetical protein